MPAKRVSNTISKKDKSNGKTSATEIEKLKCAMSWQETNGQMVKMRNLLKYRASDDCKKATGSS